MNRGFTFYYQLFYVLVISLSVSVLSAQNRSIDGTGNNLAHPEWGAVGTNQLHYGTVGFDDGVSSPAGYTRPNPRAISNVLFEQAGLINDATNLSDYAWVWGQFIDHDITLVVDHSTEQLDIPVPIGDPFFDPLKTGTEVIPMLRSLYDPSTGTSRTNPRAWPNGITAFIDGSGVYGSSKERANWLRTFEGGKLRTSVGNLLPYNTVSGEYNGEVDPSAPEMAMPMPHVKKWFVAGDVRANENPMLTSIHTLFVREHNRLCDELSDQYPNWSDEELYQFARKLVGGMIQSIVYNEWLPTMGVHLPEYFGYDPDVNPGMMNIFTAAAYRYGHTVVSSEVIAMDNDGEVMPHGQYLLREVFFNPNILPLTDIGPMLKGMATQVEQEFDCKMIDDLRNFLFGQPGSGGMDLAAININRGRDRGLADYNTVRSDFGLAKHQTFEDITSNREVSRLLEQLYGDINNIDPWIGMLAEEHMHNTLFGETVMEIMIQQFWSLRDGDRFYFENDPVLDYRLRKQIRQTRLSDIIERNTSATNIQENVFLAEPHLSTSTDNIDLVKFEMRIYPNPTYSRFTLEVLAEKSANGEFSITDQFGRRIQDREVPLTEGRNDIEFEIPENAVAGPYYIGGRINQQQFYRVLVKLDP
ncbi:MAG: peroxidase family protein [Saprospiraceae bacterium]|nr:peroxidase family protein [Saprospiraceae bacterium]